MNNASPGLDLLFLGSGNAVGSEGRAFSSFLLDGRYLFDCGPTVLQQLRKLKLSSRQVEAVVISHFHGDHFFGLPFLLLDGWKEQRTEDLQIAGPPGIEERTEQLMETAFPRMNGRLQFRRIYTEVSDRGLTSLGNLRFRAAQVEHVPGLECFAFRVEHNGKSLVFSGDARLCRSLLNLVAGADLLVLECSCAGEAVHLSPEDIARIVDIAGPQAQVIVTHLDSTDHPNGFDGLHVASDLARFSF